MPSDIPDVRRDEDMTERRVNSRRRFNTLNGRRSTDLDLCPFCHKADCWWDCAKAENDPNHPLNPSSE